jgi:hypothetical protein
MALAYRLEAISQGPKNSRIPVPNPLPLPLVMDMHASKHYARGCMNHRCINTVVILVAARPLQINRGQKQRKVDVIS